MYRPLDIYDDMPSSMKRYISNFGWHFNKKAYEYATKFMYKINNNIKQKEYIIPYTKEQIDDLLNQYNITITNKILHDYVYIASMCKADYFGSSITNEEQLLLFVKDTIDDADVSDETTFRRWIATMIGNGNPIDWDEIC